MMPIRTDCKPRANNRLFLGWKRGYAWTVLTGKTTTGNRPAARIIGNITTRRKGGGDGAGWKPNNRVEPGAGPVGPGVSRVDDGRGGRGGGVCTQSGGPQPLRLPDPDYRQRGQVKTVGSMPIFFAKTSATGDGRK